jgi:hypothetical protein
LGKGELRALWARYGQHKGRQDDGQDQQGLQAEKSVALHGKTPFFIWNNLASFPHIALPGSPHHLP